MQNVNIYSINDPENNQDEMLKKSQRNDRNQMVDLNKKKSCYICMHI